MCSTPRSGEGYHWMRLIRDTSFCICKWALPLLLAIPRLHAHTMVSSSAETLVPKCASGILVRQGISQFASMPMVAHRDGAGLALARNKHYKRVLMTHSDMGSVSRRDELFKPNSSSLPSSSRTGRDEIQVELFP
jgi:hypothetical protein